MFVYLAIFFALAIAGLNIKLKQQHGFALISFISFLLFFMGTRRDTGCDFGSYENRFNNIYIDFNLESFLFREEPGFHLINILVKYFDFSYMWVNLIGSALFLIGLIRFLRLSPAPVLLLALMFPIIIIQLGMSGLRQGIATSFLMLSFVSFINKNSVMTGLWVLLAAQFHQSAYIFLPLSLLAGKEFNAKTILISILIAFPAAIFLLGERTDVYSNRYIDQIYGENSSDGAYFRLALSLIPCVLFEKYKSKIKVSFIEYFLLFRISTFVTYSLIPLGFISSVAMHRLNYYILPINLLIFVCASMVITNGNYLTKRYLFIPVITSLVYITGWFSLSRHASICYVPYGSYLL